MGNLLALNSMVVPPAGWAAGLGDVDRDLEARPRTAAASCVAALRAEEAEEGGGDVSK